MRYSEIDYSCLPEHDRGAARRYIEAGIPMGGFLMSVVYNDLFEAIGRADQINIRAMREICRFFYSDAPSACYGSEEKCRIWMEWRMAEREREREGAKEGK